VRLTECRALEVRIQRLKAKIRKETQFNRQVELYTQIKQLEREWCDAVANSRFRIVIEAWARLALAPTFNIARGRSDARHRA
jgi:hypothetical protein